MPWFDWVLSTPQLNRIEREVFRMSAELDLLKAEVQEMKASVQAIVDKLVEIKAALDAAIAANDPAALLAAAAELDALQAQIAAAINPPPA